MLPIVCEPSLKKLQRLAGLGGLSFSIFWMLLVSQGQKPRLLLYTFVDRSFQLLFAVWKRNTYFTQTFIDSYGHSILMNKSFVGFILLQIHATLSTFPSTGIRVIPVSCADFHVCPLTYPFLFLQLRGYTLLGELAVFQLPPPVQCRRD